jgi:hypothetical protein
LKVTNAQLYLVISIRVLWNALLSVLGFAFLDWR